MPTFSIGVDHIDLKECISRNIRVTVAPYFDSGILQLLCLKNKI